jgi:hypothetical protein
MVTALMVVAAAAACGDDGGTPLTHDAAVDSPRMIDAPPDADMDVAGSWIDRYVAQNGTTVVAMCNVAPSAVVIDPTTAVLTTYNGVCKPDGTFRIMSGMLGTYYLRLGSSFYETNHRKDLDFSIDHLGRSDVAAVTGVTLNLSASGMNPWAPGDGLYAFSSNIGFAQVVTFTSGSPNNGDTTLTATAPWNGYKIDGGKLDTLQLLQLGSHTTIGGLAYTSLDRVLAAPPFTMANNSSSSITGAFGMPTPGSLNLRIDVASFNQFSAATNPTTTTKTMDGSLFATVSTDAKASPSLLSFGMTTSSIASLDFGTLAYGDPFPVGWQRVMRVQAGFQVPYTYSGITTPRSATITRYVTKATADAGIIDAVIGPPTSPTFDDQDAFTATQVTTVPKLSWGAPTFGTPTDYEVQVYEVSVNGSALKFTSVLKLTTKQTTVRIPENVLLGQRQYVFSITARIRQGIDIYTTPLKSGETSASAETLTALVTTGT